MTQAQIIALATPVFFLLIALEWAVGRLRHRPTYRLHDALSNIGLGVMSEVVKMYSRLLVIGLYSLIHEHGAVFEWDATNPGLWLFALLAYDFLYYWYHRAAHRVAMLWAAHVVHHQSEDFNLSTALRQSSTSFLLSWVFFIPLALLGVPPVVFAVVAIIDLVYQYWVHTEHIGRLGWFDRWFVSPSNHRVHHAVNDAYLDRNFGGILIIWDRLFGTYAEEDPQVRCIYGTRDPLRSFNPFVANLQVWRQLAMDSWRARRWADKCRVWIKPPGWRPTDVAARFPRPAFDLSRFTRHDPPPLTAPARWAALGLFGSALLLAVSLNWIGVGLTGAQRFGLATLILLLLWAVGFVLSRQPGAPGPLGRAASMPRIPN